jgi:L-fuconolactonase
MQPPRKSLAEPLRAHIDAHQHFWEYNQPEYGWIDDSMKSLRRDFLPGDLKTELDRNGFHGSVAVQARQTIEETRWLLELAARSPFILGVIGWVDLRSPLLPSVLASIARHPKLIGIRHIVQSEPDDRFLLQPDFLRGVALLEEFDLSYDILIYPEQLNVAAEFVKHFPRQRFVLDHLAKPPIKSARLHPWASAIKHLASFPNVHAKLSGLVTEADWQNWKPHHLTPYLDVAFDCFGPDRLMFGSDWPVCTVASAYSGVLQVVLDYLNKCPADVHDSVLGGNAKKFWKLSF